MTSPATAHDASEAAMGSGSDHDRGDQGQQAWPPQAGWSYQSSNAYQYTWPGDVWSTRRWSSDGGWWTGPWGRSQSSGWSRDSPNGYWSGWAGDQPRSEQHVGGGSPENESSGQRRASVQSGTQSTEATAHSDEPDLDHDDRDQKDSDLASTSERKDTPKTGKDHVPEFDGKTAMREYERRVRLFEASTGIDESYRAQKLMERLTGAAWQATESLDLAELSIQKEFKDFYLTCGRSWSP